MRLATTLLILMAAGPAHAGWLDLWLTADQQAQRLAAQGQYEQAAQRFTTPDRMGWAWFQAGDFERAAAAFGRVSTAEGAYNRGNALIMLGRYEEAIASYEQAVSLRPDWQEAADNLNLARLRKEALAPPDDDAGGTGGMLEADEIVIDTSGRVANSESAQTVEETGQPLSEQELRALWLRRVETRPGDYLAIKFANQLAREGQQEGGDE